MKAYSINNQMSVHLPVENDGRLTDNFFNKWIMETSTTDYDKLNEETFQTKKSAWPWRKKISKHSLNAEMSIKRTNTRKG